MVQARIFVGNKNRAGIFVSNKYPGPPWESIGRSLIKFRYTYKGLFVVLCIKERCTKDGLCDNFSSYNCALNSICISQSVESYDVLK